MNALPQENGDYFVLRPLDIERGERLLYRLTEFGRILWEVGIDVGPRKLLDLAETLDYVDITNKEDFYDTLKCSLLPRHEQDQRASRAQGSAYRDARERTQAACG